MNGCPDIEALEALVSGNGAEIERHVERCEACQGVLALLAGREQKPSADPACARAEVLIAAGEIGELSRKDRRSLEEHLAACESCRELTGGDTFPDDDPSA